MRPAIFVLLLALGSTAAFAGKGNGSAGFGNKVPITGAISARTLDPSAIRIEGNRILDGKSGEKLIQVDTIDLAGMEKMKPKLVRSRLGSVDGYEYVPEPGSSEPNSWVICPEGDGQSAGCVKLSPLSRTNSKVPGIIGTLQREGSASAK